MNKKELSGPSKEPESNLFWRILRSRVFEVIVFSCVIVFLLSEYSRRGIVERKDHSLSSSYSTMIVSPLRVPKYVFSVFRSNWVPPSSSKSKKDS